MTMFGSQWLDNPSRGYEIDQSIRFNDDDTPYLQRTPGSGSVGNDHTFTVSFWIKRGSDISSSDTQEGIIGAGDGANIGGDVTKHDSIGFFNDTIQVFTFGGNSTYTNLRSTAVFRDPTSWYHIVVRYDDTQSTDTNRVRIYVNGVQVTVFSPATYPNQNSGTSFNTALLQRVGANTIATTRNIDGYLAEIVMIDGTSLGPTSFGEYNDAGVWIPIDVSGLTYGTNGFRLKGQDSSALGDDTSGNGNDFASSGLAANDQVSDTPTNNWCTMNPLAFDTSQITLSDGNLTLAWNTPNGNGGTTALSTFDISKHGKSYWEFSAANGSVNYSVGICTNTSVWRKPRTQDAFAELRYGVSDASTAEMQVLSGDGSIDSTGVLAITGSEVGMMAFDPATGKLWVGQDGTFFNSGDPAGGTDEQGTFTGDNNTGIYVNVRDFSSAEVGAVTFNFGQSGFAHTPPTGYTALNSDNASSVAIEDGSEYFHTQLYTGTGSSGLEITNDANAGDFKPDWFWVSPRSNGDNNVMLDVARGVTSRLKVNDSDAQDTDGTALFTFETDGFHVDSTDVNFNGDGRTYVAWQWKTQGGAGSSNTDGSINTTTTSVNTTAGFSISTYAGTGANATIGHGLGLVPEMMLIKNRDQGDKWAVYHAGNTSAPATDYLVLNERDATADEATAWNDTAPTSSVFSVGSASFVNASSENFVAYVFAPVEGYSKFGSYIGNGNAYGPMVNVGFQPAFLLLKSTGDNKWIMKDTKRDTFNPSSLSLVANNSEAELSDDSLIDINSNGFKLRTTGSGVNSDGVTYIYMAFAENPFVGDGVAPATAR